MRQQGAKVWGTLIEREAALREPIPPHTHTHFSRPLELPSGGSRAPCCPTMPPWVLGEAAAFSCWPRVLLTVLTGIGCFWLSSISEVSFKAFLWSPGRGKGGVPRQAVWIL